MPAKLPQLRTLAEERGLDKSGAKATLIARLLDAGLVDSDGDILPEDEWPSIHGAEPEVVAAKVDFGDSPPEVSPVSPKAAETPDPAPPEPAPPLPPVVPVPQEHTFSVAHYLRVAPRRTHEDGAMFRRWVQMQGGMRLTIAAWHRKYSEFQSTPVS